MHKLDGRRTTFSMQYTAQLLETDNIVVHHCSQLSHSDIGDAIGHDIKRLHSVTIFPRDQILKF